MIPSLPRPAWLRVSTVVYALLFFAFLFLPLVVMAVFAFNDAPYPAPPIQIRVDDENAARSEALVEKHFQRQFNEILHKGFLSKSLVQDEKDSPTVYTVNSVNKIRQMPLRLTVKFQTDMDGRSVEREDFEVLKSSDYVHERITVELNRLARPSNSMDIAKAMLEIGDSDTLKLFESKTNSINLQFLDDLARLEANSQKRRTTFIGPIYSPANWGLLQKRLAPFLVPSARSLGS